MKCRFNFRWRLETRNNYILCYYKTTRFKFLNNMDKVRAPYIILSNCIMSAGTTYDSLYRNDRRFITSKESCRFNMNDSSNQLRSI